MIDETVMKREAEDAGVEIKDRLKWYRLVVRSKENRELAIFCCIAMIILALCCLYLVYLLNG